MSNDDDTTQDPDDDITFDPDDEFGSVLSDLKVTGDDGVKRALADTAFVEQMPVTAELMATLRRFTDRADFDAALIGSVGKLEIEILRINVLSRVEIVDRLLTAIERLTTRVNNLESELREHGLKSGGESPD